MSLYMMYTYKRFVKAVGKRFASPTPTSNAPTSPGPYVTAIASISSNVTFASSSASLLQNSIFYMLSLRQLRLLLRILYVSLSVTK